MTALSTNDKNNICPLCKRKIIFRSNHHLIPKSRNGNDKSTILICEDCHEAIHALFSNKELEKEFNTVESLLYNDKLSKSIQFLSKQNPHKRHHTKLANNQRRRGRNG
jgi:hypothetical protein